MKSKTQPTVHKDADSALLRIAELLQAGVSVQVKTYHGVIQADPFFYRPPDADEQTPTAIEELFKC